MQYELEDIRGVFEDGGEYCLGCREIETYENVNADELITQEFLENDNALHFCDECGVILR